MINQVIGSCAQVHGRHSGDRAAQVEAGPSQQRLHDVRMAENIMECVSDKYFHMLELIDEAKAQGIGDGLYIRLCEALKQIKLENAVGSVSSVASLESYGLLDTSLWRRMSFP